MAEELGKILKQISQRLSVPRLFNTLKYLDNALPSICSLAIKRVTSPPTDPSKKAAAADKECGADEEDKKASTISEDKKGTSGEGHDPEEEDGESGEDGEEEKTSASGPDVPQSYMDLSAADIYQNAYKVRLLTEGTE